MFNKSPSALRRALASQLAHRLYLCTAISCKHINAPKCTAPPILPNHLLCLPYSTIAHSLTKNPRNSTPYLHTISEHRSTKDQLGAHLQTLTSQRPIRHSSISIQPHSIIFKSPTNPVPPLTVRY